MKNQQFEIECEHARRIALRGTRSDREATITGYAPLEFATTFVECAGLMRGTHSVDLIGNNTIELDYSNSFGPTVAIDDIIERMTMSHWRSVCSQFCGIILRAHKRYDLVPDKNINPKVTNLVVTFMPEQDSDIIGNVHLSFRTTKSVYDAILDIVSKLQSREGEEICAHCDAVIHYTMEEGKTIVACPECGKLNPLCNECDKPNRAEGCGKCELVEKCKKMNSSLAFLDVRKE